MALTREEAERMRQLEAELMEYDSQGSPQPSPQEVEQPQRRPADPFMMMGGREAAGLARGAFNKFRQTTSIPILRFLDSRGVLNAKDELAAAEQEFNRPDKSGAEKVGEFAGDMGMLMAPTPFGKAGLPQKAGKWWRAALSSARGAALSSARGAAQHQAQNYGATGEIDAGKGAEETAVGTGAMLAGSAVPPIFKWLGVKTLQGLTRAPKNIMKGYNKPTKKGFEQALEERLVPIVKGGFGEAERRGMKLQGARDDLRADLLTKEGVSVNLLGALKEAERDIQGRVTGSRGLLPSQRGQAISHLKDYRGAAKEVINKGGFKGGFVPGAEAVEQRKLADANASFIKGKTPAGLDLASQAYRESLENQLLRGMQGKGEEMAYKANKAKMAELAPVIEAFGDKALSNYSWAPELISGTMGGVGGMATGRMDLALLPLAMTAARRYPGVAPLLYETGRAAGSRGGRLVGNMALSAARTAKYSPEMMNLGGQ
jgi:hypothetical protein